MLYRKPCVDVFSSGAADLEGGLTLTAPAALNPQPRRRVHKGAIESARREYARALLAWLRAPRR